MSEVLHSVKFQISRLNVFKLTFHSVFRLGAHTIRHINFTKTLHCSAVAVRGLSACAEAIKDC